VRARGASAGSQCARKHRSIVFYIELIIFVSKVLIPTLISSLKLDANGRVAQCIARHMEKAGWVNAQRREAWSAQSGRRKNKGEAWAHTGFPISDFKF
jgi:hypothetical protein